MSSSVILVLSALVALALGVVAGYFLRRRVVEGYQENIESQGRKFIENALQEAEKIRKEGAIQGKETAFQLKQEAENEIRAARDEIREERRRHDERVEQSRRELLSLEKREGQVEEREQRCQRSEKELIAREQEAKSLIETQRERLEQIAGLGREEARQMLMDSIESEARLDAAKRLVRIESEMKQQADRKGKHLIALAVSRYAGEYVADRTVSVVPLPNEEMKGRIIGREGRNIRAIEAATGIDIIIDDTPEAVILSGFNPVRREVARLALEQLIADGRIHPARIEEVVSKVTQDLDASMQEAGEQATFDVGAHGMHAELVKLLGRLKYRTSYGQNMLQHSLEVAFLCGVMASELGIDVRKAKRAGLLHDIGKAVDHEVEGSHAVIGRDLARKFGEAEDVVYAIGAHHEDQPMISLLDILVQAADALSGARPGSRKEMLQSYVKRLEDLEQIANGFKGVEKSYAIQAGRDLRIVADSGRVSDDEAVILSRDIARAIEQQLTYPGQIRVTVIRETRAVEFAR